MRYDETGKMVKVGELRNVRTREVYSMEKMALLGKKMEMIEI